jgi:hypothetical protein
VTKESRIALEFVTDEAYRLLLEEDLAEVEASLVAKAPKAATVLAGSLLEALLAFALGTTASAPSRQSKFDNMTLDKLISEAKAADLLTDEAVQLSVVVKSYRNLIHPGRARRLERTVDEDSAQVAAALVRIVARHLESTLGGERGNRAAAVLSRLEDSSPPPGVLDHLIQRMPTAEVNLLLRRELPRALVERAKASSWKLGARELKTYERAFALCWSRCASPARRDAARCVAQAIGNESDVVVAAVVDAYLRPEYLDEFDEDDRELAVAHLLARLDARPTKSYISSLSGMEAHLSVEETTQYFSTVSRIAAAGKAYSSEAAAVLAGAVEGLTLEQRAIYADSIDQVDEV